MHDSIPTLTLTISTFDSDSENEAAYIRRSDLPLALPAPPLRLVDWSLDIGLPLEGMGFRFECQFPDLTHFVVCEVYAENGSVGVERDQGIEEQNEDDLSEEMIAWLTETCPAVVRHLFAPLLAKGA